MCSVLLFSRYQAQCAMRCGPPDEGVQALEDVLCDLRKGAVACD